MPPVSSPSNSTHNFRQLLLLCDLCVLCALCVNSFFRFFCQLLTVDCKLPPTPSLCDLCVLCALCVNSFFRFFCQLLLSATSVFSMPSVLILFSVFLSTVNCRLSTSSKLHYQIRLSNRLNRQLHGPRFLPFQLHAHFPLRKSCQPSFKKFRLAHRLARRNLRQAPPEALEIRRLLQRPVQPRRADLQDVPRPRNQFLHVQDHAQLLAHPFAIRVADFRVRLIRRLGAPDHSRCIADPRGCLRYAIDVHPQKPLLADFPFDISDFQPFRTRHSLGGRADFLQIHPETPRPKPVRNALQPAPTKKWAVRPLIRSTRFRAKSEYIPPARQKQDTGSTPALAPLLVVAGLSRFLQSGSYRTAPPFLAFPAAPTRHSSLPLAPAASSPLPLTAVANRSAGNPRPWQAAARWTFSLARKQSSLQNSEPRHDALSRIFATQSAPWKTAPHPPRQSRLSSCAGTGQVLGLLLRRGAIPQRSPFPGRLQPTANEFPIR